MTARDIERRGMMCRLQTREDQSRFMRLLNSGEPFVVQDETPPDLGLIFKVIEVIGGERTVIALVRSDGWATFSDGRSTHLGDEAIREMYNVAGFERCVAAVAPY